MIASSPKCSIIVTVYNIEDYIEDCLTDIVGQTLKDIEIIVVDDGSTDGSRKIIDVFAERYSNISKIYFEKNTIGGVATAANAGLDAARGQYVGFADGDDRFAPDMFERLVVSAETSDADLAMCGYLILNNQTGELTNPADQNRWKAIAEQDYVLLDDAGKSTLLTFIAVPWRKIYRRRMLDEHAIRFPVGDCFFEDNPFHWEVILTANRCALVPAQLCQHRVSRPGQTMESADANLFKLFLHHKTIHENLVKTDQRSRFGVDLAAWLISQSEWIAKRCPPEQQVYFQEALVPCYARHSLTEIRRALKLRNTNSFGAFLAFAAKSNSRRFFRDSFVPEADRTIANRARFILMQSGPIKMLLRGLQFCADRFLDTTSRIFSSLFLRDLDRRMAQTEAHLTSITRDTANLQNRRIAEIIDSLIILDDRMVSRKQFASLVERLYILEQEILLLKSQNVAKGTTAPLKEDEKNATIKNH